MPQSDYGKRRGREKFLLQVKLAVRKNAGPIDVFIAMGRST